jgi:predicted chitinase
MSKKGVSKIAGNPTPKVGEKTLYTITGWYPSTPESDRNPALVTWELFKKRSDGNFTTTNIRKKGDGNFTFGEVASKNTYRLEAYLHEPEGSGATTIDITPQQAEVPKINKVELLYVDDSKGTVFSYTEKLVAKAQCVNLVNKKLVFTLWEDDAKGDGHDAKNLFVDSKEAIVDRTGTATAEFVLTKALMQKAMQGERDPKELEFYVTVEYYKNKKHTTGNIEVKNPDYRPSVPAPGPKSNSPSTRPSSATPKPSGSPAAQKPPSQKEEKGIIDSITESARNTLNELWDWVESKGTVKPDQKPTAQKPEGKTVSVVGQTSKPSDDKKGKCFCNRDFTAEEFEKIIHGLRDSETRVKKDSGYALFAADNCTLPETDKTIEKLRVQINSLFTKYEINTCLRKLHFLAQVYHETDRLRTTLEYATKKDYKPYFGRGLMQLTWESNYKIYKAYTGIDFVKNYEKIENNLYNACDSAGWYWKQGKVLGVGKRWKGPANPPVYVKIHNPDYPKETITYKDGKNTVKYGTVNLGLIADDDKVDLISYLVNGGSNGLSERRNYVLTLKNIFKYPQDCVNKNNKKPASTSDSTSSVTIRLTRKWQTDKSTIGEFTIDNTDIKGYILEEKGPDTTLSGIEQRVPVGTYNLEWHSGTKIKKGLKLYNDVVSKSRAILIHSGNTADDTEGCLLPGSTKSKDFVGGSKAKLKEIFDHVEEIGIKNAKIIISQSYE